MGGGVLREKSNYSSKARKEGGKKTTKTRVKTD